MEIKFGPTVRLPKDQCPICKAALDAATVANAKGGPNPGDFTICINCASILLYGPNLRLIAATKKDLDEARRCPKTVCGT